MQNRNAFFDVSLFLIVLFNFFSQEAFSHNTAIYSQLNGNIIHVENTKTSSSILEAELFVTTNSFSYFLVPILSIDTTRNLATDLELAKHLCDCPVLPPFLIKKLLDSGYTQGELVDSGIPAEDVIDAERGGWMIDSRDSKAYKTITIGDQTWMAENLNYGKMINGDIDQTDNSIPEKHCFNNDINKCAIYGGLYEWEEAMEYSTTPGTQGLCPTGWHLPTDEDWQILEIALGLTPVEANAIGDRGTNHGSQISGNEAMWFDNILDQNSDFGSSGFDVLPSGIITIGNVFYNETVFSILWSSTGNTTSARIRRLINNKITISRASIGLDYGVSVRCVQN